MSAYMLLNMIFFCKRVNHINLGQVEGDKGFPGVSHTADYCDNKTNKTHILFDVYKPHASFTILH